MELTVVPSLDSPQHEALKVAIARVGLDVREAADNRMSAWRQAGLAGATAAWPVDEDYALSPRSTRGATRA